MSDYFGETQQEQERQRPTMMVPGHVVNEIEFLLKEQMVLEMATEAHRAPIIWIEGDADNAWDQREWTAVYGPVTLTEARIIQDDVYGQIVERYRKQILLAISLGKEATRELYLIGCEADGIPPII